MSGEGYFMESRSVVVDELEEKHPMAFLLLHKIARMAKWSPNRGPSKLELGQAIITHSVCPYMTRRQYRTAISLLVAGQYVTIKTTNKNTVVTLCNSDIYDLNINAYRPAERPVKGQQEASKGPAYSINKEERRKKEKHKASAGEVDAVASVEEQPTQPTQPDHQIQPDQPHVQPDLQVVADNTGDQPRRSAWELPHPDLFHVFWWLYRRDYAKEVAMVEWARLKFDRDGYEDVILKLKGQIDSSYYFEEKNPGERIQPAIYLRERRFNDMDSETRVYRKTFEYVYNQCVERGMTPPPPANIRLQA